MGGGRAAVAASAAPTLLAVALWAHALPRAAALPPLPPDPSSPSCMLNGKGCPLPAWAPTWTLRDSIAIMDANLSGFSPAHRWGFVTLDWQSGATASDGGWLRPSAADCNCEAASAARCQQLKAAGLVKRCSIYHNLELALEWLESERAVMDDEHVRAGWFLRYPNGTVYAHNRQMRPGLGPVLRQYFIDWRNDDAAAFFVRAIAGAASAPGVDATFTDDSTGVPEEHPEVAPAIGLKPAELAELQRATQRGGQRLAEALAAANRTCWQCVDGVEGPVGGHWGMNTRAPPADPAGCAAAMRALCAPERQRRGMFMSWDAGWNESATTPLRHNQTVAAFLVSRPPLAFLGTSYGLNDATYSPLFELDVGEPAGLCEEHPRAVFSRRWTRGVASLDCDTNTASLPFATLQAP